MGVYLVTNITDATSDPKTIAIGDIPGGSGAVYIHPGGTLDLETLSTRNQILESRALRVHYNEGRVTIDTLGTSPRERIFVDAQVTGVTIDNVSIIEPVSISVLVGGIETNLTGAPVGGGRIGLDVIAFQGTSPWVISGNIGSTNDTNYGVVGSNTLRTAAQLGNATGAAAFGAGATNVQTLRVVLPTDQTSIPSTQSGAWTVTALQGTNPWVTSVNNFPSTVNTNYGVVGASTIRSASQIGNATGAADFNAGLTTAQTLRVVLPTDQTAIPVVQSGAWTVTSNQGTSPWIIAGTVDATQSGSWIVNAVQSGIWSHRTLDGYGTEIGSTSGALNSYITNVVTVNQGTNPWVTTSNNFPSTVNTNYGVVGASTIRTAAQIGNATGAADFNYGTVGAQTLRTASHLADGYGNLITSQSSSSRQGLDTWKLMGVPQHFNSTVGTTPATITPSSPTVSILVSNPMANGAGDLVQISFDGGTEYFDIIRGQSLSIETEVSAFMVKSNSAGTFYQILVTRR